MGLRDKLMVELQKEVGKGISVYAMSQRMGLTYRGLLNVMQGKSQGSIGTWQKVMDYLDKKDTFAKPRKRGEKRGK